MIWGEPCNCDACTSSAWARFIPPHAPGAQVVLVEGGYIMFVRRPLGDGFTPWVRYEGLPRRDRERLLAEGGVVDVSGLREVGDG